jgi:3-hydroxybutyryl-CoA dehydrogenase
VAHVEIEKVGVVGCGTMGSGICEVVARAGLPVHFVEVSDDRVEAGWERIRNSLDRAVQRGKLEESAREEIIGRISGSTSLKDLADAGLVTEAIPEQLALKQALFAELDELLPPEAILATNTSSLPIIDLAVQTSRANRVLGFHFFNPAPVMQLIELVSTVVTSPAVVAQAQRLAERIGKTPVAVADRAGFLANLLLFPYLNQAVTMLEAGYATREDIDAAMQLGAGHPMGPLALMDLIGLDSANSILERMYEQFGDVRYAPRPMIRQLLAAGYLGRKTGRGFYTYAEPNSSRMVADAAPERPPVDESSIAAWRTVGVLGTGTMASGIAEVSAKAGFDVVVRGRTQEKAQSAIDAVGKSLAKAVDRGKLDGAQRDEILGRLRPTADIADFAECDIIIEAVAEDLALKKELFAELDRHAKADALLATTTSSLPVIECAMATSRPEQVVGIHFFNPAAIMRLVEIVDTVRTDPARLEQARAYTAKVGKHGVLCGDQAGFIVNALLFPYLNEAVKMLEDGYATVEEIDTAMKLGGGHPMGPFALMDVVGLDVTLEITKALYAEFRKPGLAPADLLGHMVAAGYLGRKTRHGFYVYDR